MTEQAAKPARRTCSSSFSSEDDRFDDRQKIGTGWPDSRVPYCSSGRLRLLFILPQDRSIGLGRRTLARAWAASILMLSLRGWLEGYCARQANVRRNIETKQWMALAWERSFGRVLHPRAAVVEQFIFIWRGWGGPFSH